LACCFYNSFSNFRCPMHISNHDKTQHTYFQIFSHDYTALCVIRFSIQCIFKKK
jgi:hypothetical protein